MRTGPRDQHEMISPPGSLRSPDFERVRPARDFAFCVLPPFRAFCVDELAILQHAMAGTGYRDTSEEGHRVPQSKARRDSTLTNNFGARCPRVALALSLLNKQVCTRADPDGSGITDNIH